MEQSMKTSLLTEFQQWQRDRADLSALENDGEHVSASAWQASDDMGCALAERLADALYRPALTRIAELKREWSEATEGEDPDDYQLSEDDWSVGLGWDGAREILALLEEVGQ